MDTDPLSFDDQTDTVEDEDLLSLLDEYQSLNDTQQAERRQLLERIEELIQRTSSLDTLDEKLDQFTSLLLDIRSQIAGMDIPVEEQGNIPKPKPKLSPPTEPKVVASGKEIQQLTKEVEDRNDDLDEEIDSLVHLLDKKKEIIQEKDRKIEELNDRLDLLSDEKSRLADELEKLNTVIDSWKSQLDLLQQLASSDPRYRVIEALKKHGSLSDIQLAFTMGTSINQLRKYIEDLIDLGLVKKSPNGRYVWTGKEFEPDVEDA